ncbi:indolepyruvate decarboxylase [Roseivirga pacifica]|uniref:Indolepyruvate decarboxylase n=1 Tax=Roseivirga pacifica TaxID=1267423 RepID=A0A1I0Q324_9BACT|nr:thiamine pyrophosphate-binding protein [Roseivirga pacifica]RKQ43284.1 indolepyruvate decarboxylase [Roseivirga pacifica]SEW21388.1 indolepyruvate decarboxylase [Roseivirga pacifica]
MKEEWTVAEYLKVRLEQLGLDRMFGVAGNYTAAFLDTILADKKSPITISGNSNELCAGYAADAYARLNGISALYVTYSVGAFSLLNTIAGSFTEQVPLILINGAPTNKEDSIEKNAGLLYSHTTGYQFVDIHMFRPITVAAERITDAKQAPFQIDSALTAMLTNKKPVYLEVTEDVWRAACMEPTGTLSSGREAIITVSETEQAVKAAMEIIKSKSKSIFWAGIELQRFGLQQEFLDLLKSVNEEHVIPGEEIHFVTSALSKSVISEDNEYFEGCVTLNKEKIKDLVGDDGCLIGIGAWTIGKDTGNQNIRSASTILASHDSVLVGAEYFPRVTLASFIEQLKQALAQLAAERSLQLKGLRMGSKLPLLQGYAYKEEKLTYDLFFKSLEDWITKDDVLIVDAGFPLIGAQSVKIPARNGFVAQAAWLAIGYSVAAATGVKCAQPDKRAIVAVGDGAFHETCQAVADHHAYGQNTVVFVLANGIYGIEQEIVNPNPFREPPIEYKDELLDSVYPYNDLPAWKYDKLTDAFGGKGRKANTVEDLLKIFDEIRKSPDDNFVVEITIPKTNVPSSILSKLNSEVGEDEIENPHWPPAGKF